MEARRRRRVGVGTQSSYMSSYDLVTYVNPWNSSSGSVTLTLSFSGDFMREAEVVLMIGEKHKNG